MNRLKENYGELTELIFKVSYLCLAFATFVSFVYISPLQPILVRVTLVMGVLTVAGRMLHWKKYKKMPCLILMILFCVSFLFSAVMNRQYGITDNLKWIIWTGIQFFGLYVCDMDRDEQKVKREFAIISHIFICVTAVVALISLLMLAGSYSAFFTTADNELIIIGYQWDRLWGAYTDPNYGAVCSVIGILLSGLYLIKKKGVRKLLYAIAMVLNYAYLIFSDSRTGELALVVCGGVFLYLWLLKKFRGRRWLKSIVAVGCVMAIILAVGQQAKTQNITYQKEVAAQRAKQQIPKKTKKNSKQITARQKNIREDVSSGRLSIWQSAIEVWESSPVYGAGYTTVTDYAKEHVPGTYIVNNSQGDYTSMHNMFFCVLAYQGAVGTVLFVLIALRMLGYIIIPVLRNKELPDTDAAVWFCCIGCVAVSMMFLLDGIYTNSPNAAVLWLFGGYLIRYTYQKRKEEGI